LQTDIFNLFQDSGNSCLVLPELTRLEFSTFHNALFASEGDLSLDFFVLIKVAEVLGAELVIILDLWAPIDTF
jgi:hypothetical protein